MILRDWRKVKLVADIQRRRNSQSGNLLKASSAFLTSYFKSLKKEHQETEIEVGIHHHVLGDVQGLRAKLQETLGQYLPQYAFVS